MTMFEDFDSCPYNWTDQDAMKHCVKDEYIRNSTVMEKCCVPLDPKISQAAGILCICVAIIGFIGNLLTLLAIPWATNNNLFGFNLYPSKYTNIFIVNLAFADFLYCSVNLPLYTYQYLNLHWDLGESLCQISAAFRYFNAFAAWMAVGFVALSRCISLKSRRVCRILLYKRRGYIAIFLMWLYAFLMVLPSSMGVYGKFGYNRRRGKCDFVKIGHLNPHLFFYALGFLLPLSLLVVSYSVIWYTSRKSSMYLKSLTADNKQQLESRDHRLTIMILLVCGCYVLFVGPIAIINIFDAEGKMSEIHLIFFMIYWLQFSFNFIIYALRNDQFRKAYKFFLRCVVMKLFCIRQRESPRPSIFFINANLQPQRNTIRRRDFLGPLDDDRALVHFKLADRIKELPESEQNDDIVDDQEINPTFGISPDLKLNYAFNMESTDSVLSCKGTIQMNGNLGPTVIILNTQDTILDPQQLESVCTKALKYKKNEVKRKKKKEKKVRFYSETDNDPYSSDFEDGDRPFNSCAHNMKFGGKSDNYSLSRDDKDDIEPNILRGKFIRATTRKTSSEARFVARQQTDSVCQQTGSVRQQTGSVRQQTGSERRIKLGGNVKDKIKGKVNQGFESC